MQLKQTIEMFDERDCPLCMCETRLPIIKQSLNVGYRVFAKNRLRLTGRCNENCSINPTSEKEQSCLT